MLCTKLSRLSVQKQGDRANSWPTYSILSLQFFFPSPFTAPFQAISSKQTTNSSYWILKPRKASGFELIIKNSPSITDNTIHKFYFGYQVSNKFTSLRQRGGIGWIFLVGKKGNGEIKSSFCCFWNKSLPYFLLCMLNPKRERFIHTYSKLCGSNFTIHQALWFPNRHRVSNIPAGP